MDWIDEKLRLLKPILPQKEWDYLRLRYFTEKDRRKQAEVENLIDLLLTKHVPGLRSDSILLPPPDDKKDLQGDYPVGDVIYPDKPFAPVGIREAEWIKHCGIFGKTGSGKTTLAFRIIRELCRHDKPFLIFDYKRNYRDILKHPDFKDEEILIFTVGRSAVVPFQFNPKCGPAGIEDHVWIKQLSQIIEKVYLLGPGANDVFMESAGMDTFREMHEKVVKQKKKARELLWWASVKRTLNAINYPGLGEVLNCARGYPIEELLKKKVILELDGLSNSDQAFIIGSLLLWIYHFRMREAEREILKHFIIIEEAHHLFRQSRNGEEDIADILMREIRELGEAIIVIDQHPHKMSVSALGNLATKFALTMSLNQDVVSLSNSMLLDRNEKRYLSMLTVGKSIFRSDRFPRAVLVAIPPFPIQKGTVRDEDLKAAMEPYLANLQPETPSKAISGNVCGIQKQETLSPLGRIVLENISLKPLLGVVGRFKELGLKVAHGYKVIEELSLSGFITPVTIDGKRLYEIAPNGEKVLGKMPPHAGRGGLEHRYFVEQIRALYTAKDGFAFIERDDIDIVIESFETTLAIQVETGKSDIPSNLMKLGRYKADLKYMLATNRETEIKIKGILKDLLVPGRESIKVKYAKDFLGDPPEI
jgi:hypothetical protein